MGEDRERVVPSSKGISKGMILRIKAGLISNGVKAEKAVRVSGNPHGMNFNLVNNPNSAIRIWKALCEVLHDLRLACVPQAGASHLTMIDGTAATVKSE